MNIEKRASCVEACRARNDGDNGIYGYAAVFYNPDDTRTEYELDPGWFNGERMVERIAPGAFDTVLADDDNDTVALFNHDADHVLGRESAGTLKLEVDDVGLRYSIVPPDTQFARDLRELVKRGDVAGSSFGFMVERADYEEEGKTTIRNIKSVSILRDVGPVTFPAYEATLADARSVEAVIQEVDGWKDHLAREKQEAEAEAAHRRWLMASVRLREQDATLTREEREAILALST